MGIRGIQMGKQLINQGSIWIIALGTLISIIRSKWILEANNFTPKLKPCITRCDSMKVSNLMQLGQRSWNLSVIKEHFREEDVLLIK